MQRRIGIFIIGVVMGIVLLQFLPKPVTVDRAAGRAEMARMVAGFPVEFADARGALVKLDYPPRAVVSLAPSLTETIFALGAQETLVGVTRHCVRPPMAKDRAKVGDAGQVDVEKVLALKPEWVVASALTPPEVVAKLRSVGLNVAVFAQDTVEGVQADTRRLARVLIKDADAVRMEKDFRLRSAVVEELAKERGGRPRALLLVSPDGWYAAAGGSWASQLLKQSGADNVADAAGVPWPKLDPEAVVRFAPEVIILATSEPEGGAAERFLEKLKTDPAGAMLPAVKNGRVAVVGDDLLTVPGPRMVLALEKLAAALGTK